MITKYTSIGRVHSPFKTKLDIEPGKFATRNGFDLIEGIPILDIKIGWLTDKIKCGLSSQSGSAIYFLSLALLF